MERIKKLLKQVLKVILFIPALVLFEIMRITTELVNVLDEFYNDD